MTKQQFLRQVMEGAGLRDASQAEQVTEAVFSTLHRRITEDEAQHVASQLPQPIKEMWEGNLIEKMANLLRLGGAERLNREQFLERVTEKTQLERSKAEQATRIVFGLLQQQIHQQEADDLAAQLPPDLRSLWQESFAGGKRQLAGASTGGMPETRGGAVEETTTQGGCCEVMQEDWVPFLIGFTNIHAGQPVQIQVGTEERGFQVLATDQPLIGIEPECKQNDVLRMDVAVGQTQGAHPEHLVHYVQKPDRLVLETDDQGVVRSLIVEAEDGLLTWVRLAA